MTLLWVIDAGAEEYRPPNIPSMMGRFMQSSEFSVLAPRTLRLIVWSIETSLQGVPLCCLLFDLYCISL